jgi:hypothetical protein
MYGEKNMHFNNTLLHKSILANRQSMNNMLLNIHGHIINKSSNTTSAHARSTNTASNPFEFQL